MEQFTSDPYILNCVMSVASTLEQYDVLSQYTVKVYVGKLVHCNSMLSVASAL